MVRLLGRSSFDSGVSSGSFFSNRSSSFVNHNVGFFDDGLFDDGLNNFFNGYFFGGRFFSGFRASGHRESSGAGSENESNLLHV